MGALDQSSEPATIGDLWRLVKAAWADEPSMKAILTLPNNAPIVATVAGAKVPHGSNKRIPRAAFAQSVGTSARDPVTVGEIDRTHITIYASAVDTVCHLLVVL